MGEAQLSVDRGLHEYHQNDLYSPMSSWPWPQQTGPAGHKGLSRMLCVRELIKMSLEVSQQWIEDESLTVSLVAISQLLGLSLQKAWPILGTRQHHPI